MVDNPYLFGNPEPDRLRLETQSRLLSERLRQNAPHFIQGPVTRILDLGCGDDQLGRVLCKLYPEAHLLGVDKDEKAIRTAQARAQEQGLTHAEYRVGDVNDPLPEG